MKSILNDDDRLLGTRATMEFLGNISKTTLYRYVKEGLIPPPKYMGRTSLWRLGDLRDVHKQLPLVSTHAPMRSD